jgi:hypothetical protein
VHDWWRWTMRGVAVLALVACGVVLPLHPSASYRSPILFPLESSGVPTAQCLSPFNRLTGSQQDLQEDPHSTAFQRAVGSACSPATNARERLVEALGAGAVLLAGLSFLPRRRTPAVRRLEPSTV